MRILLALLSGGFFGAGLHISGMTDTGKVQGFLDLFGAWDPTLVFVMGGAIVPMAIAWRMVPGRSPLAGGHSPSHRNTAWTTNLYLGPSCSESDGGLSVCAQGQQSHR
jgi:hypothetical protein